MMPPNPYYAGKLLVSNSSLLDSNFHRAVVLLIEHNEEGAFGLVINRRSEVKLGQLIEAVPESAFDHDVYLGGPVGQNYIFILHQDNSLKDKGDEVAPGVNLGSSPDLLDEIFSQAAPFKIFYGYSGWNANQLDEELRLNSWQVVDATQELVFDTPDHMKWRLAMLHGSPLSAYFAAKVANPLYN